MMMLLGCGVLTVAPLAGSVDRNLGVWLAVVAAGVAPLAGSVDRNQQVYRIDLTDPASLPSRGAWIEIGCQRAARSARRVAPLAGSVDRNVFIGRNRNRLPMGRSPHGERG